MTNDISNLLAEAKPLYFKKKRQKQVMTTIGSSMAMLAIVFMATFNNPTYSQEYFDELAYGSVIESYGFEVDEYGLLEV